MTTTIALAGKGGTGKTTVAALLVRFLTEDNGRTVLAIDADPSTNLNLALGLPLTRTVGDIREELLDEARSGAVATGGARQDYLNYQLRLSIEEGDVVDLLAMGRPEGPGCYCPVNHMLRQIVDGLGAQYDYIVIDNEAGMEHLSRRTTKDVDLLLVITDPTIRGVKAAEGIVALAGELDINVKRIVLVVNRVVGDELPEPLQDAIARMEVELAAKIPDDPNVYRLDAWGRPLVELSQDSPAARVIRSIAEKYIGRS
ncbi:MAG: AAA family ATPase [Anaerolineales bacterium]|jgi:CO dehydrogenase maturation factor|nr:AAA family ATPase [Anaerolineales bacterium]